MTLTESTTCNLCQQPLSDLEIIREMFIFKTCLVCRACQKKFKKITGSTCQQCGVALEDDRCVQCLDCMAWLERVGEPIKHVSLYHYNDIMQQYFKYYKFQGGYHLAELFRHELSWKIRNLGVDVVVPIPLSEVKYNIRGFNQVTAWLGNDYQSLLQRVHQSNSQSEKSRSERLSSENPFRLNPNQLCVKTAKICVVDDIYTTGTTIRHVYSILRQAGYQNLCSISLAHA
ncbi:ComF family protein [Weissella viridescens]|uniref:ComF family protein n=1 Tax=Weissella viridescens TaxID=1629 RepID=A0A3P2RFJ3_WEIVI|nr:ComF family protein [Weissella viridescens]RRG17580.1 ComF family protein [Weissella viridescens]